MTRRTVPVRTRPRHRYAINIAKSASQALGVVVLCWALAGLSTAVAGPEDAFITSWETTESDQTIFIPTALDTDYDFTIDWGDGTVETISGSDPNPTHSYAEPGVYQVAISGTFPRIFLDVSPMDRHQGAGGELNKGANAARLKAIDQWGAIEWTSMEKAFAGAERLTLNASDSPDLSAVTSTRQMFYLAGSFNGDIGDWDVSNITNMSHMFENAASFNQDIGRWDVSNVSDLRSLFSNAESFDQDISAWRFPDVDDMSAMFSGATSFNQDISAWDVSSVETMSSLFSDAESFDQDISAWDVANVRQMNAMFSGAESFNQDLSDWQLSDDVRTVNMFQDAKAFEQAYAPPGVELN